MTEVLPQDGDNDVLRQGPGGPERSEVDVESGLGYLPMIYDLALLLLRNPPTFEPVSKKPHHRKTSEITKFDFFN